MLYSFSKDAISDIENIENYFVNVLQSPQGANKILDSIFSGAKLVSIFPYIGPKLSDFYTINNSYYDYRFYTIGNYRLIYRIETDKSIIIINVIDTRQNYLAFYQ